MGTKLDLRDDQDAVKRLAERRQTPISFSEAQGLASDLDAYRYLECSALTQLGLKQVSLGLISFFSVWLCASSRVHVGICVRCLSPDQVPVTEFNSRERSHISSNFALFRGGA